MMNNKVSKKIISDNESIILEANNADHNLSNIHFIVHSILISTISLLATNKNQSVFNFIILLSSLGIFVSIFSMLSLMRSEKFKEFWEDRININYRKDWNNYINNKCKNRIEKFLMSFAQHSRKIIIVIFIVVYIIFIFYS